MKKKISCILPINKDLKYLDQSIGSILDQTYKNFELIIISNTSNEMINKKIFHYKKKDKRVKVFKKTKGNLSELLNYGISKAQGDFIARQDSDDISNKKRFEHQINWFKKKSKKFKKKILCGTNGYLINENNTKIGNIKFVRFSHNDIQDRLLFCNCIIHSSVMLNYKFLKKKLKYDKFFEYSQDYDLWTKLINFGEIANLKSKLVYYRVHKTKSKKNKFKNQIIYAILVALNFYNFKYFKKFKKFSKSLDIELKKFSNVKIFKNQYKMLGYIYGKNLGKNDFFTNKKLTFVELLKNINKPLLFKTFIKNIV